jgi:hypothetical protein
MSWTPEDFENTLCLKSGKKIRVSLKENRSTMMSIKRLSRQEVRISMHRFFLNSNDAVIDAVIKYIRGHPCSKSKVTLQNFIQENITLLDYSNKVNTEKLITTGELYDLTSLYDEINQEYFNSSLKIHITWYGERYHKHKSSVTFGQYDNFLKMIKMHRILDQALFPKFFVCFTLYHEMLHHIIPPTIDQKGQVCYHNAEFKLREKQFKDYRKARSWELTNRNRFFHF